MCSVQGSALTVITFRRQADRAQRGRLNYYYFFAARTLHIPAPPPFIAIVHAAQPPAGRTQSTLNLLQEKVNLLQKKVNLLQEKATPEKVTPAPSREDLIYSKSTPERS